MHHSPLLTITSFVLFLVSALTPTAADLFGCHSTPPTHSPSKISNLSAMLEQTDKPIDTEPLMSASALIYVALRKKLFIYHHEIFSPLLKRLRQQKEHHSHVKDFSNAYILKHSDRNSTSQLCFCFSFFKL